MDSKNLKSKGNSDSIFDSELGAPQWLDILNWKKLPDFGACHQYIASNQLGEFYERYLATTELKKLASTIGHKFDTKRASESVVLLKGDPGSGKTTFLYSLLAYAQSNENICSNYVFYIAHANSFQDDSWRFECLRSMRSALKLLYTQCSQTKLYRKLYEVESDTSLEGMSRQVQKLKTCIVSKAHRDKFSKQLVFILDNVDTVNTEDHMVEVFQYVHSRLEPGVIKKWFSVRSETIQKFSVKTRAELFSYVSNQYTLPNVSLSEIVNYRIQHTTESNGEPKIPFSNWLSDEIVGPICDGNIRNSFLILNNLLHNVELKGFQGRDSTSEKVLEKYFNGQAAKYMLQDGLLVNLHEMEYSMKTLQAPLTYDLLSFVRYTASEVDLLAMLYLAVDRRNRQINYLITSRTRKFRITARELHLGLRILSILGLINWNKIDGIVKLTAKGGAVRKVASQEHYIDNCMNMIHEQRSDLYWKAAKVIISHESISNEYSAGAEII